MDNNAERKKISIILPAKNESASLKKILQELTTLYKDEEIIVVNDGSTDNTLEVCSEFDINIITHPYSKGNGASIKSGARKASGDFLVFMDADGQHEPSEISNLIECLNNGYDMVVGARSKGSKTSLHRDLANMLYNRLASYVTSFKVEDLTSGFRVVKNDTVRKFIYLLPNTFSYPSTITMAYLRSGRSIKYVPIATKARKGKSKIKLFQDGIRFFLIITKIATLFSPFRIFLPVSLIFFMTGLLYYLFTYITAGRFTNMSALLFSSSIIIFMMGLISEQISQMRYDRVED